MQLLRNPRKEQPIRTERGVVMTIDFNGKVAVVTGGAGEIGRQIVRTLLESNARVAIVGRGSSVNTAASALSELGDVRGYRLDLSRTEEIAPAVEKIRAEMGEIELLVQAAGLLRGKPGLEITVEEWDEVMNVNARGMFFMMQAVVRQSMQRTGGSIVNISSMAGIRGMHPPACSAHYSASKGAVVALSMQAAVEWAGLGIRCNCVAPGGVKTGPMATMDPPEDAIAPVPMHKLSEPSDIADGICFLLSDRAAMITGQTLVIDGGSSAVGY